MRGGAGAPVSGYASQLRADRAPLGAGRVRRAPGPVPHPALSLLRALGNASLQRLVAQHRLQPKLAVNPPGDVYEQEADRVAEHVMRMPGPGVQRQCACGGTCAECAGHTEEEQVTLQRQAVDAGAPVGEAPATVHEVLRGRGEPLDPGTRAFMEHRFEHDFSAVRIHRDQAAGASARMINALAYTVGDRVVFGEGQYRPGTTEGRRLLAHELVHVIQQGGGLARSRGPGAAAAPVVQRRVPVVQRAIVTHCISPGGLPGITRDQTSQFGQIVETVIEADYCLKLGCALMRTEWIDNPITSSYIAFLAFNNHLTAAQIAQLAVLSQISLNRPDILVHRPLRQEFEEIKPNSVSGRYAGRWKVGMLTAFYGTYHLPYVPGVTWVPTPEILLGVAPGGVEVFLRTQRLMPGLVVYDVCVRGDSDVLTLYAILALLILIILIILSRGTIVRGAPIPLPAPAFAALQLPSGARTGPRPGGAEETGPAPVAVA